jgi:hypothetical protein
MNGSSGWKNRQKMVRARQKRMRIWVAFWVFFARFRFRFGAGSAGCASLIRAAEPVQDN